MSERVKGRHRAPQRASTPLSVMSSGVTQALGVRAETLSRSGAAIAVTSGLVAAFALPADAAVPAVDAGKAATQNLAANNLAANNLAANSLAANNLTAGASSARGGALAAGALTASAKADVVFDRGSLTATSTRAAAAAAAAATKAQTLAQASAVAKPKAKTTSLDSVASTSVARASNAVKSSPSTASSSSKSQSSSAKSASSNSSASSKSTSVSPAARGSAVVSIASRYMGIYYVYGGETPAGFDCSGLVKYVFNQLGVSLPRVADDQMQATRSISASQARPGDLVFFLSGGSAFHVGIVTSPGRMIDAPRTGKAISERAIWSSSVVYRRVTG